MNIGSAGDAGRGGGAAGAAPAAAPAAAAPPSTACHDDEEEGDDAGGDPDPDSGPAGAGGPGHGPVAGRVGESEGHVAGGSGGGGSGDQSSSPGPLASGAHVPMGRCKGKKRRHAQVMGVTVVKKRMGYTALEKARCIEVLAKVRSEGRGYGTAVKLLNGVPGFEKIDEAQLRRWTKPVVKKKLGRPVATAFEAAVFDELV